MPQAAGARPTRDAERSGGDDKKGSNPPPADSARLSVASDPTGATVEVGIQTVNDDVTLGTGRVVGTTPITDLELIDADVNTGSANPNHIYVEVRLAGYVPRLEVVKLSDSGLQGGQTYDVDVVLNAR